MSDEKRNDDGPSLFVIKMKDAPYYLGADNSWVQIERAQEFNQVEAYALCSDGRVGLFIVDVIPAR